MQFKSCSIQKLGEITVCWSHNVKTLRDTQALVSRVTRKDSIGVHEMESLRILGVKGPVIAKLNPSFSFNWAELNLVSQTGHRTGHWSSEYQNI